MRTADAFIPYALFLLLIGAGVLTQYSGTPVSAPAAVITAVTPSVPDAIPEIPMSIPDDVTAESVLIGNLATGEIYVSRAPERLAPIASLTKLFLIDAAFSTIDPSESVAISKHAVDEEGNQGDLLVGERFTLRDLARLTLTSSSNDGAVAIREELERRWNAGHGGQERRSAPSIMNARLGELGLEHTFFQNVTGLDDNEAASNYSTAGDLFAFARRTYATPVVWELARDPVAIVTSLDGEVHEVEHTNPFVATLPNIIGSKTGTTDQAKESLVILMESPVGRPIAVIILGSEFSKRIEDAEKLLRINQLAY